MSAVVSLKQLSKDGQSVSLVELNSSFFETPPNEHLIYLAIKREQLNRRAPSAFALTRAEVSGGGKKPWKQKGTGRARVGSIRSPLWVGGGRSFGPRSPRFTLKLNKKSRQATFHALLRLKQEQLMLVESFDFLKEPKAKLFRAFLKAHNLLDKKVLLVGESLPETLQLAARNFPNVELVTPNHLSYSALLYCDVVLSSESYLKQVIS